jgi:hypothetical protein
VDVAGISEEERSLVLGSALWRDRPGSLEDLRQLAETTVSVVAPRGDPWSIYYVGFSVNGWTKEAQAKGEAVVNERLGSRGRAKWRLAGVRLLDLAQVDEDLARWSATAEYATVT